MNLLIDGHKLHFHPDRVARWQSGEEVFPIYVEIGPSGACNHRCSFCAFDYLGYQKRFIDRDLLISALEDMARHGVKSAMFAGEGEPLLHPDILEFLRRGRSAGLDLSMASNAVLLTSERAEPVLENLCWIRVSLNAGTPATYAAIHGCGEGDFERVLGNLTAAAGIKRRRNLTCTLGVQALLLPENRHEMIPLGKRLREAGVDYFTIKPYIPHPQSGHRLEITFPPAELSALEAALKSLETSDFTVAFRSHGMNKLVQPDRGYRHCLGLPFFAKIISSGEVFSCGPHAGKSEFCYGNLHDAAFSRLWTSDHARAIRHRMRDTTTVDSCMRNCRLDEINRYLWALSHPGPHVNFI